MSKIKDNLIQVAVDTLHSERNIALVISNRDSLIALTVYNEAKKKAERDYAESLNNKDIAWSVAKKALTKAMLDARWERDAREEEVFRTYLQALDDADDKFAKTSKTLDSFVTYDDEIFIEGD